VLLRNLVSVYTQRWLLILGAIYVLTIIYAPEGIVGAVRQWLHSRKWLVASGQ
jgi:branched-chain amino acid transport system permease protein